MIRRFRTSLSLSPLALAVASALLAGSSVAAHAETQPFIDERADGAPVYLVPRGGYSTGKELGSEIAAYDPLSRRIFVTNGADVRVDVLDARNLDDVKLADTIDISDYGADLQSVAVSNGRLAIAIAAESVTAPGKVAILDTRTLREIDVVEVGALPDSVTFTHDGRYLLVANEGEPRCVNTTNPTEADNPDGSVTVIEFAGRARVKSVRTADFSAFNDRREELIEAGVRLNWPSATVAQDLEPEYIATEGNTAWVALQENNAFAVIDLKTATVTDILPLGRKAHSVDGSGLDASDRDGPSGGKAINIQTWPVLGMYMPDSIAAMKHRGATYILSANEGDAREYYENGDEDGELCFADVARVKDLPKNEVDIDDFDDLRIDARAIALCGGLTVG